MTKPAYHFALGTLVVVLILLFGLGIVAYQLAKGQVEFDFEQTCKHWFPLEWSRALPPTLFQDSRESLILSANLMKYTYQKACKVVEGEFPPDAIVKPLPNDFKFLEWIWGIDRGVPELFGMATLYRGEAIILTFRGSMTGRNWDSDFHARQDVFLGRPDMLVHHGFNKVAQSMFSKVDDILSKYSGMPLLIIGHSLGSGVSGIMAARLRLRKDNRHIKLVTFGTPRTGNQAFAEFVTRSTDGWNVQNLADFVVALPTSVLPSRSGALIYQHWGQVIPFTYNQKSLGMNHHIDTYLNGLNTQNLRPFVQ